MNTALTAIIRVRSSDGAMGELRNAARTRGKIIEAARAEFADRGFAGARIEAIARRAGLSKQLLYHYFANKTALIEEILEHKFKHRAETSDRSEAEAVFSHRFLSALKDPVWVRFLIWEAAELSTLEQISAEKPRRAAIQRQRAVIAAGQKKGDLPSDLPADFLNLAVSALATYPLAFAQVTKMATGYRPDDPTFQRKWAAFLLKLSRKLAAP